MQYELIIFDLDGTLLDTSPGIFNSVRYAEKMMGFKPIPTEKLHEFVGPPPKEMYKKIYEINDDDAMQAAKYHREYGRTKAIYEAKVYPGIKEILQELKSNKLNLAVATLKSQSIAESILAYFDLLAYFDCVVGMDDMESLTKADTIRIAKQFVNAESAIFIGDSKYDAIGAKQAGIDFMAVLYGFGFNEFERIKENPYCMVAETPTDIKKIIEC